MVIVDELVHTNVEDYRNRKRWEDVMAMLTGINVILAINIQHIESLKDDIGKIISIEV